MDHKQSKHTSLVWFLFALNLVRNSSAKNSLFIFIVITLLSLFSIAESFTEYTPLFPILQILHWFSVCFGSFFFQTFLKRFFSWLTLCRKFHVRIMKTQNLCFSFAFYNSNRLFLHFFISFYLFYFWSGVLMRVFFSIKDNVQNCKIL